MTSIISACSGAVIRNQKIRIQPSFDIQPVGIKLAVFGAGNADESQLEDLFSEYGKVLTVAKLKDFSFVVSFNCYTISIFAHFYFLHLSSYKIS